MSRAIIPAETGWHVVTPTHGEDGSIDGVWYSPVVGWACESEYSPQGECLSTHAYPITVDGVVTHLSQDDWALRRLPNGPFTVPHHADYDNEEGLIAHWRKFPRGGRS